VVLGCTSNLTDVNVARRLRVGIVSLAIGLGCAELLKLMDASPIVRVLLFVPFFISANAFFQAMYMNCGYSALAGRRHTAHGTERIADSRERRAVRARGIWQIALAFVGAAALTASFVLV
jgi:hypothetical protein